MRALYEILEHRIRKEALIRLVSIRRRLSANTARPVCLDYR